MFQQDKCQIIGSELKIEALEQDGLWTIVGTSVAANTVGSVALLTMQEAHERLGHVGEDNIKRMMKNQDIDGLANLTGQIRCKSCKIIKSHATPNRRKLQKGRYESMKIIFSDYCQ